MKIRIKFRKYGVMKFIGHLDMMRYFQKAMRRAEIDIAYSEGFSPHQIMSFAAPLGVGITSDGEYLDIEVHSTRNSIESVKALNDTMVEGVEIVSYRMLPEHAKTAMSIVAAADYNVFYKDKGNCPFTLDELKGKVKAFYDFQVEEADGCPFFYLKVSTGSVDNVKPELLLEAFYRYLELPYNEMQFQIHRVDVYARKEDGTLIALDEMGDDILE